MARREDLLLMDCLEGMGIHPTGSFLNFVDETRTIPALKQLSASDLLAIPNISRNHLVALREMWEDGSAFRTSCKDLSLSAMEQLERLNIRSLAALSSSQLNEVSENCDNHDRTTLRRLFRENSTEYQSRLRRREDTENRLAQQNQSIAELRARLETQTDENRQRVRESVDELARQVGNVNIAQFNGDINASLDALLLEVNTRTECIQKGDYASNEELIEKISAGAALRGIFLDPDPNVEAKTSVYELMLPPAYVTLLSPAKPSEKLITKVSSAKLCDTFCNTAEVAGTSFSTSFAARNWMGYVEQNVEGANQQNRIQETRLTKQTNEAGAIILNTYPKAAFMIKPNQRKITEYARSKLLQDLTETQALDFLKKFGSHVVAGIQHVGGWYGYQCKITTQDTEKLSVLQTAAAQHLATSTAAGFSGFGIKVDVGFKYRSESRNAANNQERTVERLATTETKTVCYGPNVSNPEVFNTIVDSSNKTWHIINRGDPGSFIGIWEFIRELEDVTPKMLSNADYLERCYNELVANHAVQAVALSPPIDLAAPFRQPIICWIAVAGSRGPKAPNLISYLYAYNYYGKDERDSESTYLCAHDGTKDTRLCPFMIIPEDDQTYSIQQLGGRGHQHFKAPFLYVNETPGMRDFRNNDSTYACVHDSKKSLFRVIDFPGELKQIQLVGPRKQGYASISTMCAWKDTNTSHDDRNGDSTRVCFSDDFSPQTSLFRFIKISSPPPNV